MKVPGAPDTKQKFILGRKKFWSLFMWLQYTMNAYKQHNVVAYLVYRFRRLQMQNIYMQHVNVYEDEHEDRVWKGEREKVQVSTTYMKDKNTTCSHAYIQTQHSTKSTKLGKSQKKSMKE